MSIAAGAAPATISNASFDQCFPGCFCTTICSTITRSVGLPGIFFSVCLLNLISIRDPARFHPPFPGRCCP